MIICSSINPSARNVIHLSRHCRDLGSGILNIVVGGKSTSCCFHLHPSHSMENYARLSVLKMSSCSPFMSFDKLQRSWLPKHQDTLQSFTVKGSFSAKGPLNRHFNISFPCKNMNMRLLVSTQSMLSKIKGNFGRISWSQDCVATGLTFGLLVCYSSSEQSHAEAAMDKKDEEGDCRSPHSKYSHGKKVSTDYSVIGIPGDGRCLFRSVVHGACVQVGKPAPNESRQRELADELRARVADEFLKRRKETEWFVEGDFDSYVAQIRKPHVWGGEPELFMASHVLKMPITVYMHDKDAGGLISIAEYGQEYGKENPIRVLYHGFGHYDALVIPGRKGGKSKL